MICRFLPLDPANRRTDIGQSGNVLKTIPINDLRGLLEAAYFALTRQRADDPGKVGARALKEVHEMNSNLITITTVMRSASVVPSHAFGMGDVCPQVDLAMNSAKRRTVAVQATAWATPGSGQPWSPPVT